MEVKAGYKQTEVGVIPEDWKVQKLSDVAELTSSKRIFESDYVASGIPFYRGKEISLLINNASIEDEYFILDEKYNDIKRQFGAPQKGDILITAVGTLGNVYLVPNNNPFYFKDGNLIWLRKIKNVFPSYLAIQLRNRKTDIINNAIGSTQKALTIVVLNETLIPLPSTLAEQGAIAEALSDADALIEALEQLLAKKRQVKQGAMQELLTGKRRLPGFSDEWKTETVAEFGDVVTGGTPPTAIESYWNGDIPWVTPTDITSAKDISTTEREISFQGLNVLRKLSANSVLVTCIASIGKNAILRKEGACNQQINAIVPNKEHNADFLYYLFENNKQYLLANAGTTATSIISKKDFSELTFSVPRIPEQTAIAEILSDMDAEITALEGKLSKARDVKAGMMSELLTGRVRLKGKSK